MLFFYLTRCLLQEPGSLPALSLYTTGKEVLVRGSETVISVLGMTSIVSSLSHWFGVVFQVQLFLLFRKSCSASSDHPQDRGRRREVCSFSFGRALLCPCSSNRADRDGGGEEISAGPQRLKPNFHQKSFVQICKNLCLLLTAVLHFIHSMVQPVLMSLSASRSSNRASHVRVCLDRPWLRLVQTILKRTGN